MQGLILAEVGRVALAEVEEPTIQLDGDVIVAVDRAGLCGSDLHPYTGAEAAALGLVCGHEAVGQVVEAGSEVRAFAVGDRVVVPFTTSCGACGHCQVGLTARCEHGQLLGWAPPTAPATGLGGCQTSRVRVPLADSTLVLLPDGIDDDTGVLLTDNMPTAWQAVERAALVRGQSVAVIGLGAVGLCAVAAAFAQGARAVVAVDPIAARRAAAVSLGASAAAPEEVTDLRVQSVIEAAGPPTAQELAARIAAPGATISIIAVQTAATFAISPVTAYDNNLTIRCGRASVRTALDTVMPLVVSGDLVVPTSTVVTDPGRPLAEGPDLYAAFADREEGLIKATFAI